MHNSGISHNLVFFASPEVVGDIDSDKTEDLELLLEIVDHEFVIERIEELPEEIVDLPQESPVFRVKELKLKAAERHLGLEGLEILIDVLIF